MTLLLSASTYRLQVRKFVQEVFDGVSFDGLIDAANEILTKAVAKRKEDGSSSSSNSSPDTGDTGDISVASNSETNTIIAEIW